MAEFRALFAFNVETRSSTENDVFVVNNMR